MPRRNPAQPSRRDARLHAGIRAECAFRGWRCYPVDGRFQSEELISYPNFVICLPRSLTLLIEAKETDKRMPAEYQANQRETARSGHAVHTVRSIEEFRAVLAAVPTTPPPW